MSRLFPFRSPVDLDEERTPRLVDVDDDAADEVFGALGSETARAILARLHEDPRTTSDLAEAVDTSVQNASYHLDNLRDAELVEVVDTWYSERGTEMNVYAPTDESLVVFAGEDEVGTFRSLLERLVGTVSLLGVAWVAYARGRRLLADASLVGAGGSGAAPNDDGQGGAGSEPSPGAAPGGTDGAGEGTVSEPATADGTTVATDGGTSRGAGVTEQSPTYDGDGAGQATETATETATAVTEVRATRITTPPNATRTAAEQSHGPPVVDPAGQAMAELGAGGLPLEFVVGLAGVFLLAVVVTRLIER